MIVISMQYFGGRGAGSGMGGGSIRATATRMRNNGEMSAKVYDRLAKSNFSEAAINKAVNSNWLKQSAADKLLKKKRK